MRKSLDFFLAGIAALCALVSVGLLAGLVAVIAQRGGPAVTWGFLTEQIRLVGAAGGIFWNLVGTLILLATAFAACAPLAIGLALVERVWLHREGPRRLLRTLLYTLNGVPSIVFGIFGFVVFVQWCGWGKSWLCGGLVLAFMMLPTVTVSLMERLKAIPPKYVEAAAGLGLNRAQIVWAVLLPQRYSTLRIRSERERRTPRTTRASDRTSASAARTGRCTSAPCKSRWRRTRRSASAARRTGSSTCVPPRSCGWCWTRLAAARCP